MEQTGYEKHQEKADRRERMVGDLEKTNGSKTKPRPRDRIDEVIELDPYEVNVREDTWYGDGEKTIYRVDVSMPDMGMPMSPGSCGDKPEKPEWKPSIHMGAELDDVDKARELASKVADCLLGYGFAKAGKNDGAGDKADASDAE